MSDDIHESNTKPHERDSFTMIEAPPIPLPIHILVHRMWPFRRRNSARPVTIWRTPARTMISIFLFLKNRYFETYSSQGGVLKLWNHHYGHKVNVWFWDFRMNDLLGVDFLHRNSKLFYAVCKLWRECLVDLWNILSIPVQKRGIHY